MQVCFRLVAAIGLLLGLHSHLTAQTPGGQIPAPPPAPPYVPLPADMQVATQPFEQGFFTPHSMAQHLYQGAPLPPPLPLPKLWCGGVEFGLSGSEGNAQNFKMRLAGNAKRTTPDDIFSLDTLYTFAEVAGRRNENRWLSNGRYEWLFRDTPWSVYTDGSLELNEFRPYDFRVASHVGLGYQFVKTASCSIRGRAGAGASREFGGPAEEWIPEAQLGGDFEFRLSGRQKIVGSVDYYPDIGEWGKFRIVAKASYEILVDPDWNVTLKFGAQDIYDNHSRGGKFNDLDYFATLLWKF